MSLSPKYLCAYFETVVDERGRKDALLNVTVTVTHPARPALLWLLSAILPAPRLLGRSHHRYVNRRNVIEEAKNVDNAHRTALPLSSKGRGGRCVGGERVSWLRVVFAMLVGVEPRTQLYPFTGRLSKSNVWKECSPTWRRCVGSRTVHPRALTRRNRASVARLFVVEVI